MRLILFRIYKVFLLTILVSCLWASSLHLHADELIDKGKGNVVASGHVVASLKGVTINTDKLNYFKKQQLLVSSASVRILYRDRIWKGSDLVYHVSSNTLRIHHFNSDKISANYLDKNGEVYSGGEVEFSACPHQPAHYRLEAKRFELYPNDQIVGHEVLLKLNDIPIFYSPYYALVQGYQHPIFLIPAVGSSYSEGAYIKQTMIYDWSSTLRSRMYLDYMSRKGIGLGGRLFYDQSSIYGYYLNSNDHVFDWTQRVKDPLSAWTVGFCDRHLDQPSGFRQDETKFNLIRTTPQDQASLILRDQLGQYQQASVAYQQDHLEQKQDWLVNVEHYPKSQYQNINISQKIHRSDAEELMTWRDMSYSTAQNQQWQDVGKMAWGTDSQINWDVLYRRQNNAVGEESSVFPRLAFTVRPLHDPIIQEWGLRANTEVDLDENRVTWDERSDLVEMLPEVAVKSWPIKAMSGDFQVDFSAARIHERRDIGVVRNMSTERLLIQNRFRQPWVTESNLRIRYEGLYDQYLYGSGDTQYQLGHQLFWEWGGVDDLHSSWMYQNRYRGGYTPFYFDDIRTREERLTHQLFWPIDSTLQLRIDDGYNIRDAHFEDETVQLQWNATVSMSAQCLWARDLSTGQGKSFQSSWTWRQQAERYLSLMIDHDLRTAQTRTAFLRGGWRSDDEAPWIAKTMIRWSSERQRVMVDSIRIARDFGCIRYAYEWDGAKLEHQIMLQIDALPFGSMGLRADENGFGMWGLGEQDAIR